MALAVGQIHGIYGEITKAFLRAFFLEFQKIKGIFTTQDEAVENRQGTQIITGIDIFIPVIENKNFIHEGVGIILEQLTFNIDGIIRNLINVYRSEKAVQLDLQRGSGQLFNLGFQVIDAFDEGAAQIDLHFILEHIDEMVKDDKRHDQHGNEQRNDVGKDELFEDFGAVFAFYHVSPRKRLKMNEQQVPTIILHHCMGGQSGGILFLYTQFTGL